MQLKMKIKVGFINDHQMTFSFVEIETNEDEKCSVVGEAPIFHINRSLIVR